jgi:predicted Fe-S protein YdhL (DUF1289 family)
MIVESPCIKRCCVNEDHICTGCFRSVDEIVAWTRSDNEQKQHVLATSLQRKNAYFEQYPHRKLHNF